MFAAMPEGKNVSRRNFEKIMEQLFSDQEIVVGTYKTLDGNRNMQKAIVRREK